VNILDVVFLYQLKEDQMVRWHSRQHAHTGNQYEFHYFVGGRGSFRTATGSWPVRGGQLFLTPPGQVHEILVTDLAHPISYYALLFEPSADSDLLPLLQTESFRLAFPLALGTNQRLFFEEAKAKFAQRDNPSRGRATALRLEAFVHDLWADHVAQNAADPGTPSGAWNLHVEQALGLLQSGVFENLSLATVAARVSVSEEHLIRLFRKHLNITPMKYLQVLKLETATSLLLNSDLSIKEIAWKLGYPNQFLFSRNFRAHAGVPPTAYRTSYFQNNPDKYHMKILPGRTAKSISDISGHPGA